MLVAGQTVMEVTGLVAAHPHRRAHGVELPGPSVGHRHLRPARYVAAAHARNPDVQVLDTRKTTPGLRALEKAAVRAGGGVNHRSSLSEAVLVKDNHLAGVTITEAVARARALWPGRVVQIECDTLDQVAEAAKAGADALLLDNMTPARVAEAVALARAEAAGPILTEVSGGVTLETIGDYAAAGPDRISVGALTHSATVLDLGLDLIWRRHRGELIVLLAIDVGNTETVIGLYARTKPTPAPSSRRTSAWASAPRPIRPRPVA